MSRSMLQMLLISRVYDAQKSPCDHGCRFWSQCPQCRVRFNAALRNAAAVGVAFEKQHGSGALEHFVVMEDWRAQQ